VCVCVCVCVCARARACVAEGRYTRFHAFVEYPLLLVLYDAIYSWHSVRKTVTQSRRSYISIGTRDGKFDCSGKTVAGGWKKFLKVCTIQDFNPKLRKVKVLGCSV
jgi:hypothetical protein